MKKLIILGTILSFISPIAVNAQSLNAGLQVGNSSFNISVGNGSSYGGTYGTASQYGNVGTYSAYGNSGSQCYSGSLTLCSLIVRIVGYLNQILFLLIGLSVVVFVYYVFKYFIKSNEKHDEAGKYIMYSLIGFFVIVSMWGLVNILQNTFGIGNVGYSQNSWSDITNLFPR